MPHQFGHPIPDIVYIYTINKLENIQGGAAQFVMLTILKQVLSLKCLTHSNGTLLTHKTKNYTFSLFINYQFFTPHAMASKPLQLPKRAIIYNTDLSLLNYSQELMLISSAFTLVSFNFGIAYLIM